MRKSGADQGSITAQKLFINPATSPQVVFATGTLGINTLVKHNLSQSVTQFCTQFFIVFNRLSVQLITTIHRPNNDNNKGE